MREKVIELQRLSKKISKEKPFEAIEYLEQALEIEPFNTYTLSAYGWLLKKTEQPKVFIDFYDNLGKFIHDFNVQKALYWCLYDFYIKQYPNIDIDKDYFISIAKQIIDFCHRNQKDKLTVNLNFMVILKVVKILSDLDNNDYDNQLEWMQMVNVEALNKITDISEAQDGNFINNTLKERYYNQMCWIYYRKIISGYNEEVSNDDFKDFIEKATYIVQNCSQENADNWLINPYVLTVLKVVKIFNKRNLKNYAKILEWISKLNPDTLSEEVFSFKDSEGIEREIASAKEFYYQHISKAYEKLRKYKECIAVCDLGMEEIKTWHYRNHIWIRARRYFSACMITDDFVSAIKEYIGLAEKEKHWFMYHKVSLLYFSKSKINDALLFAAKAFDANRKFDMEKMINLVFDIGLLLQAKSKTSQANIFFEACGYYRNFREWNLSEELRFMIKENNLNILRKFDINEMKRVIREYLPRSSSVMVNTSQVLIGRIYKILMHGDGFIERENNEPLYFRVKENKQFKIGDIVTFQISNNKEQKPIAVNVIRRSDIK